MQHTAEAPLDPQNRITIPPHLLKLAGIEKEIVFVGAGEVIEMWNPDRYADYVGGAEEDFDKWLVKFL